jgi:di/tricarboxylate transporter
MVEVNHIVDKIQEETKLKRSSGPWRYIIIGVICLVALLLLLFIWFILKSLVYIVIIIIIIVVIVVSVGATRWGDIKNLIK